MALPLRPRAACAYEQVSLGEVMLRLDPGEGRIRCARHFHAWEGGGEYNTSRGLKKCFGLQTAVCTALVDNEVGRLIEDFIMQGGVATEWILWRRDDGIGRSVRNGLNFTERGFGLRGALGVPDRGHTAASQLQPGDFDWEELFGRRGCRWLHTGGIFAALSPSTAALVIEAVQAAKRHGVVVSYDLNYRPSLWHSYGGLERAREVNMAIAPFVDVMIGNEEDFEAALGISAPGAHAEAACLEPQAFARVIEEVLQRFANLRVVATTLRRVVSASLNDWRALLWHDGSFYSSRHYEQMAVLDRIGGGDSFASGLQFGFLEFNDPQLAVDYGAAHGALACTTPGDNSMATRLEVERLMAGGSARVRR